MGLKPISRIVVICHGKRKGGIHRVVRISIVHWYNSLSIWTDHCPQLVHVGCAQQLRHNSLSLLP
jgi:hypothetical protein